MFPGSVAFVFLCELGALGAMKNRIRIGTISRKGACLPEHRQAKDAKVKQNLGDDRRIKWLEN